MVRSHQWFAGFASVVAVLFAVACSVEQSPTVADARFSAGQVTDLAGGSSRTTFWRIDNGALVAPATGVYRASPGANAEKRAIPANALDRVKRLAETSSLSLRLSRELARARNANASATVNAKPRLGRRVAYDAEKNRSVYLSASAPRDGARIVTLSGEQRGKLAFVQTIRQQLVGEKWIATVFESLDNTGSARSVAVTEFGTAPQGAAFDGETLREGVADVLHAAAALVLPATAHAATMSEDPCFAEWWTAYEAAGTLDWREEQLRLLQVQCFVPPTIRRRLRCTTA